MDTIYLLVLAQAQDVPNYTKACCSSSKGHAST